MTRVELTHDLEGNTHMMRHQPSPSTSAAARVRGLPSIRVAVSPDRLAGMLDQAARRGRLPGFMPGGAGTEFRFADFGHPFSGVLEARRNAGGIMSFTVRVRPLLPIVFAAILVSTIWPGIWLTDSMMRMYFSWYTIPTWWWYLPLTVPFAPLSMAGAMRKSRASIAAEAQGLIQKIAAEVGGTLEPAPADACHSWS